MKKIFSTLAVAAALFAGYNTYTTQNKNVVVGVALANVEALATGDELKGKICFYKGKTDYETRIPCTADYPNIGKCGERIRAFYSKESAQCYE